MSERSERPSKQRRGSGRGASAASGVAGGRGCASVADPIDVANELEAHQCPG